jgi:CRISPR-associated protein Cas5h
MRIHIFSVTFFTAHFKRHETKKFRSTYILPPPTAIWGIVGAILGVSRRSLREFVRENNLIVGAELCGFKALANEKVALMSWNKNERGFARAVEGFEFLVEPSYRIVVCSETDLINELKKRIEKKKFEFDIYGGISDCFLKDIKNENKSELECKESVEARGMVPSATVLGLSEVSEGGRVIKVLYLNTLFYQGFKVAFRLKEPIKVVDGIAVWSFEDVERFREGNLG